MDELAEDLAEAVDAFEEERTGAAPTREWAIRRESDDASDETSDDASGDSSLGDTKMSKHDFTSRLAEAVSKAKTQAKAQETLQAKAAKKAAKQTDLKAKPRKEKATTSDAKTTKTTKAAESTREATREAKTSKTSKTLDSKSAKSAVETRVELPVGDAYEDLPAKVLAAIQYAAETIDYVYKVDTDVFVLPGLLKFVKTQVVQEHRLDGEREQDVPAYLDPSIDFTYPANAAIVKANSSPSGFKCGLAREWHFGKCTDAALNKQRYAGVNPVSVDGGHGYILSKAAAWAVSDFAFKRSDDLQRHRRIDIYEDQLVVAHFGETGFLTGGLLRRRAVQSIGHDQRDGGRLVRSGGRPGFGRRRRRSAARDARLPLRERREPVRNRRGVEPRHDGRAHVADVAHARRDPAVRLVRQHGDDVGVLPRPRHDRATT